MAVLFEVYYYTVALVAPSAVYSWQFTRQETHLVVYQGLLMDKKGYCWRDVIMFGGENDHTRHRQLLSARVGRCTPFCLFRVDVSLFVDYPQTTNYTALQDSETVEQQQRPKHNKASSCRNMLVGETALFVTGFTPLGFFWFVFLEAYWQPKMIQTALT